uniref:Uncharacterized protein n=1 Tax=Ciona savignyi TaxID=51511 RepID=H2ZH99_CIOSA
SLYPGKVPDWLQGEIIRNGPGEFDLGEEHFNNWFDGHALMHKFKIKERKVTYQSKFLKSVFYETNLKHNRIICGGLGNNSIPDPCLNIFSRFFTQVFTTAASDNCNVNVAKTWRCILPHHHMLDLHTVFIFQQFFRIDPENLETKNFVDWNKLISVPITTAHPHSDHNGDYFNIGSSFGMKSFYNLVKISSKHMSGTDPMQEIEVIGKIPADPLLPSYYHSFAMTQNYIVFHEMPFLIDVRKILARTMTWKKGLDCFQMDETKKSIFHVINKATGKRVEINYSADPVFCFHHINAYETADVNGNHFIVMDICCSTTSCLGGKSTDINVLRSSKEELKENIKNLTVDVRPMRYFLPLTFDGDGVQVMPDSTARATPQEPGSWFLEPHAIITNEETTLARIGAMDLPSINYAHYNGRKYKYGYFIGNSGFVPDSLVKVDVDTGKKIVWREQNKFPSEPIFVPRPNATEEDDGIILSTVISNLPEEETFLLILDAVTFTELARAEVNVKLPYAFHGCFVSK